MIIPCTLEVGLVLDHSSPTAFETSASKEILFSCQVVGIFSKNYSRELEAICIVIHSYLRGRLDGIVSGAWESLGFDHFRHSVLFLKCRNFICN